MAPQTPTAPTAGGSRLPGTSFADAVARLHADLRRDGVPVADMRRAASLELLYAGAADLGRVAPERAGGQPIRRLEDEPRVVARPVAPMARGGSRLRAFLDGSQRTFLVWRLGLVPVAATVAAAAVLTRDRAGNPAIAPGTLRLEHAWLIPSGTGEPAVDDLLARLDAHGMRVIDPVARAARDEEEYAAVAGDYGKMIEAAYVAARAVREQLEIALLDDWASAAGRDDDGWLVVDGRLRLAVPRAVGLVKDLSNQHLAGLEAIELFGLPPGHRTTAFVPSDRRRRPVPAADEARARTFAPAAIDEHAPTLWYLRMHDATGQDARHALVRVEAPPDVRETAAIDELSAWLLAEKTPRATADARWATLLYPVHYLEQVLKRRVAADTRGWPA